MQERKIWIRICSLTNAERVHFSRWLWAELGEKQVYLQRLCKYLLACVPNAPSSKETWVHLYPKKSYNDARLRKLSSDLNTYLEQFVAIQLMRQDRELVELYYLKSLGTQSSVSEFVKAYNKLRRTLSAMDLPSRELHRRLFELDIIKQRFIAMHASVQSFIRKNRPEDNLAQLNQHLEQGYVEEKLHLALAELSYIQRYGKAHTTQLITQEEITQWKEKYHFTTIQRLTIEIYELFYQDIGGQEPYLEALIKQLQEIKGNTADRKDLSILLLNLLTGELNQTGKTETMELIFSIYDWGIKEKVILESGKISAYHVKNFITICLKTKRFESAKLYLDRLEQFYKEPDRQELFALCKSTYLFEIGAYEELIPLYVQQTFRNPFYEIHARIIFLQAHFELGTERTWLIDQLSNAIQYVNKHREFSQKHKEPYLKRLRLFKSFCDITSTAELLSLKERLTPQLSIEYTWLAKKVYHMLQ